MNGHDDGNGAAQEMQSVAFFRAIFNLLPPPTQSNQEENHEELNSDQKWSQAKLKYFFYHQVTGAQ